MVFSATRVQALNIVEHTDFVECSSVHVQPLNGGSASPCFYCVFKCSPCSPLKGTAVSETAAPIRGMRGRV